MKSFTYKSLFMAGVLVISIPHAFAAHLSTILLKDGTSVTNTDKSNYLSYIAMEIGGQRSNLSHKTSVLNGSNFTSPLNQDIYSIENQSQGFVGISTGLHIETTQTYLPSYEIGVRYQYVFPKNIGGSITQYALSEFQNYDYYFTIHSNVFLLMAKLDLIQWKKALPYVSIGGGVAVNQVATYREIARPTVIPRISPNYQNQTQNRFAYVLGAGIDYKLNSTTKLSIGYEFRDFGKITSNRGVSTWSRQLVNLGAYQSNAGLISMTYFI